MAKKKIDPGKLTLGSKRPVRKKAPAAPLPEVEEVVRQIHEPTPAEPEPESEPTRRITLDIPHSLHRLIKMKSFDEGCSMKKYLLDLARQDLGVAE